MIEISYTLHTDDGEIRYEEAPRSEHVPRISELITFEQNHSYQVVDVLWHLRAGDPHVTVTACELSWHRHISKITSEWWATNTPTDAE